MQWEESHIDQSNFEAWLASPQDPASARSNHHASNGSNAFLFGAHTPSMLTTPSAASVADFGAFRDFDVEPRGLFIDLPLPKDFKPTYSATPSGNHTNHNHHQLSSPSLSTLDIPAFGSEAPVIPSSENVFFISPRAMTFSQGFGLEPPSSTHLQTSSLFASIGGASNNASNSTTPFGGLKKDFQFGIVQTFDVTSPMFALPSAKFDSLDFPAALNTNLSTEEDEFNDKGSLLQMIHQPAPAMPSLHQYHSALATSSATSFSLNNEDEGAASASSFGNEENYHSGNSTRMHRAHSEGDAASTSSRPISEIASSCHHCKRRRHPNELKPCHRNGAKIDRNGAEAVSSRRTCRKRYCLGCLQKYGITFADAEQPGWTCMACRGLCECAACRRKGQ